MLQDHMCLSDAADLATRATAAKLAALLEPPVEVGTHWPVVQCHAVDVPAAKKPAN